MPKVSDIAGYLESTVPSALKLDYDNVGLLCGFPDQQVSRVLTALDITLDVIDEAAALGAGLIVSHHPVIFTPMKRILDTDPEGARVIRLLREGISAVCLHTNLDRLPGGVNTALGKALGGEAEEPLDMGSVFALPVSETMEAFLARTRKVLDARDIRYYASGKPVERLAVCGGAGGDLVREAADRGCDTLVTGEVKHHQWIDAAQMGLNLVEAGHFATENAVIPVLTELLRKGFPELEVLRSERCAPISRGYFN